MITSSAIGVNLSIRFSYSHYKFRTSRGRHNGRDGVSNHLPHDCLLNRLFRRRSKKTLKLRVPGLCAGTSPVTGGFPAQRVSSAENVSIWWRHHELDGLNDGLVSSWPKPSTKPAFVDLANWYALLGFDTSGTETGIFRRNDDHNLSNDAPCGSNTSTAMVLSRKSRQILVFHEEIFQLATSEIIETINIFMFPKVNSTGKG